MDPRGSRRSTSDLEHGVVAVDSQHLMAAPGQLDSYPAGAATGVQDVGTPVQQGVDEARLTVHVGPGGSQLLKARVVLHAAGAACFLQPPVHTGIVPAELTPNRWRLHVDETEQTRTRNSGWGLYGGHCLGPPWAEQRRSMSPHLIGMFADAPEPLGDAAQTYANTAWVLMSAALVLFMTPGLAFFYGGMTRSKSTLNMIMMSFSSIGIVSVLWVIYGYSLSFAPDKASGVIGDLSLSFLHNETQASITNHLYDYAFIAFQLMFAVITLALISGAVADRMKFSAWIAFSVVWISVVYFPVAHWVFAFGTPITDPATQKGGAGAAASYVAGTGGWIVSKLGALDFAGGTAVHINAGAAGLALCLVLGVRRGFRKEAMRPHNLPLVMIGTGVLWFGWFGFNAGSALAANGLAGLAFINTQVATGAALCGWLLVERIRDGHFTTLGAASGAVAGLVAITPACGSVSPSGAIAIGGLAGGICSLAIGIKNKLGFDDALDVVGVHLVGGLTGTLLIGFFATSASTGSKDLEGLFYGGGAGQLGRQAVAAFSVMGYSFVLTLLIALALKHTMGLRVTEEQEITGIDQSLHAETAYEFLGMGGGGSTFGSANSASHSASVGQRVAP